jgi:hypothetical protein
LEARRRTAWSTVGHEQEDDRTEPRFAYVMGKRTRHGISRGPRAQNSLRHHPTPIRA